MCVSSLRYRSWKARELFCYLWPVPLYSIFSHFHKRRDFRKKKKKILGITFVFRFSLQVLSETFLILRRTQRHIIKNVHRTLYKVQSFCQILIKLVLSPQIFEKYSNIKFHKNPSSWSPVVPLGRGERTDRHDDANSRLPQFCERA